MQMVASIDFVTEFRDYFQSPSQISSWYALDATKYYYMEVYR